MAPSGQECISLSGTFLPLQALDAACLQQVGEVNGVDVVEAPVFGVAASDDKKLVADGAGRVETPRAGPRGIFFYWNFSPCRSFKVVNPEVVEIGHTFSSEDSQIRVEQLGSMVGPLPRGCFIF